MKAFAWAVGLLAAVVFWPGTGAAAAPPDSEMVIPSYGVHEPVVTTADAMTLREIISRAAQGEKTKLAGHRDVTATVLVRTRLQWKKKRQVTDAAFLVYESEDGFQRAIPLGEKRHLYKLEHGKWEPAKENKKTEVRISVGASDKGEGLSRLPFFLKDQQEFTFSLLERRLEGDHVIFRIAFRPRSDFKPLPSGVVYVDTNDFRIIHEEFTFDTMNPLPLILKNVRHVSREWRELPTGEWVVSRILADVSLRGGWTGLVPDEASVILQMEDYRFDQGYDPARFGPR